MQIVQWPTGNFGYPRGTRGRNGHAIVAIVDHIMQGWRAGYHAYLADPNKNSASFSVYQDGSVEQHVPIADAAWCNGHMEEPDLSVPWIRRCWEQAVNPNLVTVSIEHEGMTGIAWPDAQVQATIELHRHILEKCPGITVDRQHIVGHYQIDGANKRRCPGTAFPWVRLMAALEEGMTDAEKLRVKECTDKVEAANERLDKAIEDLERVVGRHALAEELSSLRWIYHDWGVAHPRHNAGFP
jgi:N-acetyl-anhydromuramyl-L-alanine amidase AmpD